MGTKSEKNALSLREKRHEKLEFSFEIKEQQQ